MNVRELESLAGNLKKSPLFNLSLSSKELFHSNMIAWLLENYEGQVAEILYDFLDESYPKGKMEVSREKKNKDLTIEFNNEADQLQARLIIELKIKSLPIKAQLEEYANDIKGKSKGKTSFMLMSIVRPEFADEKNGRIITGDGTIWQWVDYGKFVETLHQKLCCLNIDIYHLELLADYSKFVENLCALKKQFEIDWKNKDNFFISTEVTEIIHDLRIHDLVYKFRYDQLAAKLANQAKERLGGEVTRSSWIEAKPDQIAICSSMSRSTGLLDAKYILVEQKEGWKSPACMGIQLQDRSFKIIFEVHNQNIARKVSEHLLTCGWFDFNKLAKLPLSSDIYPKKGEFGQYSGEFFYKYKNLPDLPAPELLEVILEYLSDIQNKVHSYRQVILKAATL